jgi:hypothetical protein
MQWTRHKTQAGLIWICEACDIPDEAGLPVEIYETLDNPFHKLTCNDCDYTTI